MRLVPSFPLRLLAISFYYRLLPLLLRPVYGHVGAVLVANIPSMVFAVALLTLVLFAAFRPRRRPPLLIDALLTVLITSSPLIISALLKHGVYSMSSQLNAVQIVYFFTLYPAVALFTWQTLCDARNSPYLLLLTVGYIITSLMISIPAYFIVKEIWVCHQLFIFSALPAYLSVMINGIMQQRRHIARKLIAITGSLICIVFIVNTTIQRVPCCRYPYYINSYNPIKLLGQGQIKVLADGESTTGWISVTEHQKYNARLLRSDMSILGGVFLETGDSVYGIFNVMETIRLISAGRNRSVRAEGDLRGLQIGLGVGITASALQKHGVTVDLIELDPMVFNYANEWFDLTTGIDTKPGTVKTRIFLDDALHIIPALIAQDCSYDFIMHDVFTGGLLEPKLFSRSFLRQINRLMKPDGVLGMNVVGRVDGSVFQSVYKTVQSHFTHVRCFADEFPEGALRNFVIFASHAELEFRQFQESDYLGSDGRFETFRKMFELEISQSEIELHRLSSSGQESRIIDDESDEQWLLSLQLINARLHWQIMRQMFPDDFWLAPLIG